jgi:hypothetical protein
MYDFVALPPMARPHTILDIATPPPTADNTYQVLAKRLHAVGISNVKQKSSQPKKRVRTCNIRQV